jgi:phosphatidylserine decarboxylase
MSCLIASHNAPTIPTAALNPGHFKAIATSLSVITNRLDEFTKDLSEVLSEKPNHFRNFEMHVTAFCRFYFRLNEDSRFIRLYPLGIYLAPAGYVALLKLVGW